MAIWNVWHATDLSVRSDCGFNDKPYLIGIDWETMLLYTAEPTASITRLCCLFDQHIKARRLSCRTQINRQICICMFVFMDSVVLKDPFDIICCICDWTWRASVDNTGVWIHFYAPFRYTPYSDTTQTWHIVLYGAIAVRICQHYQYLSWQSICHLSTLSISRSFEIESLGVYRVYLSNIKTCWWSGWEVVPEKGFPESIGHIDKNHQFISSQLNVFFSTFHGYIGLERR